MEKLEKYFESFVGFIHQKYPNASVEQIRTCWTAHLMADYACRYWYEAEGKNEVKYSYMNSDDQSALGYFARDVGNHLLRENEDFQSLIPNPLK